MMTTNVGNILTLHKSLFFSRKQGTQEPNFPWWKKKKSEKFGSEVPKEEMISEEAF